MRCDESHALGVWAYMLPPIHPPGYCSQYGYNLTGNTTGVCPECAAKVEG